MDSLTQTGAKVMLSMSDFPEIRKLFKDYNIYEIKVFRPFKNKNKNKKNN